MISLNIYKVVQKTKKILPLSFRTALRKLFSFDFLYNNITQEISYRLLDKNINFKFIAPPKISITAKEKGIENTICRSVYDFSRNSKNELILDVGMNYGFLSLAWSKSMDDKHVIGFEVHPQIAETVKNAAIINNINNLNVVNIPISNLSGQILSFNLGIYTGSIKKTNSNKISLSSLTIDDYISAQNKRVCAIKIDTDGFDFNCLIGAEETIKKHKPMVVIETNNDQRILDFFQKINYLVFDQQFKLIDFNEKHNLMEQRFTNLFAYPEKPIFNY